jgi:hypothetical protein
VLAGQQQLLLVVVDNCEHLIGAAAELCAGLLAACDDVRVLATSRQPLAVAGEARYRLGPLALPGDDDAGEAGGSEAVALFADRARQVDTGFAVGAAAGSAGGAAGRADPRRHPRLGGEACSISLTDVLLAAGDAGVAKGMCAAGLAASGDTGSQEKPGGPAEPDGGPGSAGGPHRGRPGAPAGSSPGRIATGDWADLLNSLDFCGLLCAATGRCTEAVTLWAAHAALSRHGGSSSGLRIRGCGSSRSVKPGGRSGRP